MTGNEVDGYLVELYDGDESLAKVSASSGAYDPHEFWSLKKAQRAAERAVAAEHRRRATTRQLVVT